MSIAIGEVRHARRRPTANYHRRFIHSATNRVTGAAFSMCVSRTQRAMLFAVSRGLQPAPRLLAATRRHSHYSVIGDTPKALA
jgi:hypothetical protein